MDGVSVAISISDSIEKVLIGIYFYPRGGSAGATRALARRLEVQGLDVTLLSGSRTDLGATATPITSTAASTCARSTSPRR